jgi:hypothetical protein
MGRILACSFLLDRGDGMAVEMQEIGDCRGKSRGFRPIARGSRLRLLVSASALAIMASGTSLAQTTWNGLVSTDFLVAGNWSAGVPNAGVNALINVATANQPTLSAIGAANGLTLANNTLTITATGTLSLAGIGQIQAAGILNSSGTINAGAPLQVQAGGTLTTTTVLNGGVANAAGGTVNAAGAINGPLDNAGLFTVTAGLNVANAFNNTGTGQLVVAGGNLNGVTTLNNTSTAAVGVDISAGRTVTANAVINAAGSTITNAGTLTSIAPVANAGTLNTNTATSIVNGGIANAPTGVVNAAGQVNGIVDNLGAFNVVGALAGNAAFNNNGAGVLTVTAAGNFSGITTLTNASTAAAGVDIAAGGVLSAAAVVNNAGSTIRNAGTLTSAAQIANSGTFDTNTATSIVNGGIANAASGVVNAAGQVNGGVDNLGAFNVVGALVGNNAFNNNGTGTLAVTGGNFTGITTLTNASTAPIGVDIAGGRSLSAAAILNNAGATIQNAGTLTSAAQILNAGTLNTTGIVNGGVNNTGTVNAAGALNGQIDNANIFNVTAALTGNNVFNNGPAGVLNLGGNFTGITTFNNNGQIVAAGNRTLGVTTLNNNATGIVTLQNGVVTDNLTVNGAYTGVAGSQIRIDARLDLDGAAQRGDLVVINGAGTGTTAVNVGIVGAGRILFGTPIQVLRVNPGSPITVNTGIFEVTPLINYRLAESAPGSGIFQITSELNPGAGAGLGAAISGVVTSLQAGFHQPASAIISRPGDCDPNRPTGGPFIRLSHGHTNLGLDSTQSVGGVTVGASTSTRSNFNGFQTGFDWGVCNIHGSKWNVHFGIMGGFVNTNSSSLSVLGGAPLTTNAKFDTPFFGFYSFLTNDNLTLEINGRYDRYDAQLASTLTSNARLTGHGLSVNGRVSYRFLFDMGFIEPQIGFSYGGTYFDPLAFTIGVQPAVMNFGVTRSLLGRIGVDVGSNALLVTERFAVVPFGHASVWREFGRSSTAVVTVAGTDFNVATERVGTFGQVGAGLQFKVLTQPALTGFVRGDLRFGEKINGKAVNVGLRGEF